MWNFQELSLYLYPIANWFMVGCDDVGGISLNIGRYMALKIPRGKNIFLFVAWRCCQEY